MEPHWSRAASYAGLKLSLQQIDQITVYGEWLVDEARSAGGIGPGERERVDRRHLGDSLLFATQIGKPSMVWDLGTGVGLPGVPLAITLPDTEFVLIDRSGRRVDLLRRVLRILGLENCQVIRADVDEIAGVTPVIVSRAVVSPPALLDVVEGHLETPGVVVTGGSWQTRPAYEGWTTVEIPAFVLDQPVWLLIMRRQ